MRSERFCSLLDEVEFLSQQAENMIPKTEPTFYKLLQIALEE